MSKATADKWFGRYIRLRDTDEDGYGQCISCSAWKPYSELDCGHFVNRGRMSLRYNEVNCNAQCRDCNRFDEGNNVGYVRGMLKKWGQDAVDLLESKKRQIRRYAGWEYTEIAKYYRRQVKALYEQKSPGFRDGNPRVLK